MSCCTSGLQDVFTEDSSRKDADRYRKHGLPRRARKLIRAIEAAVPLRGKSTLEIGVGAGAVTVDMLRRGAAHATGVDAVRAQLASARALAHDFNVADKAEFVCADFAAGADVQHADVVVLDRVVCCYPDWRTLLTSAAAHANVLLALTYPRDTLPMHVLERAFNFTRRLMRSDFRFHVHSKTQMHALLESLGFTPRRVAGYFGWDVVIATRTRGVGR